MDLNKTLIVVTLLIGLAYYIKKVLNKNGKYHIVFYNNSDTIGWNVHSKSLTNNTHSFL